MSYYEILSLLTNSIQQDELDEPIQLCITGKITNMINAYKNVMYTIQTEHGAASSPSPIIHNELVVFDEYILYEFLLQFHNLCVH